MTIPWGKTYTYPGMTIEYSPPGKFHFSMVDYIVKMIDEVPKTWKGNQKYQPHTNFWYLCRCDKTFPIRRIYLSSFCGAAIVSSKVNAPINTVGSFILMKYSERAWCWWLQEYGKGNEIHTSCHWTTIDTINRQIWQYKVLCWCSVCGAQGYEEAHWWLQDHENRRGLFSVQKKMNNNSSTESKIFGVDNFLTQVIYTHYFLKDQGYDIHENVIY